MVSNVVLSSALKSTLNSINRTQETIDVMTERLATGRDVNSALDRPDNFFTARSLRFEASDQARLLDGLGQSVRVVREALIGLEAVSDLIDQAEAITLESLSFLRSGEEDPAVVERIVNSSPRPISNQILAGAPDAYFRLNETAGAIVDSGTLGPVTATRLGGATAGAGALYTNGAAPSVDFDGVNDRIQVDDAPHINLNTTTARTVELVFQADDTIGRQVLYEEGAGVNGFTIYLDGNVLYVTGEDDQGGEQWNDADINSTAIGININAGQTYHAAFVFNAAGGDPNGGAGANTFAGYIDGVLMDFVTTDGATNFPSHSGNIGIGAAVDGVQFHDGESGAGFRFNGRISDVAIYNRALSEEELFSHADALEATTSTVFPNVNYENVLDQLDQLVIDAQYRGINLLYNEDLTTIFNPSQTSRLVTEGQDFSSEGFGLKRLNFNNETDLLDILDSLRAAKDKIRDFGFTLTTDLSIIQTRTDFTREQIVTNIAGSDDLTVADANETSANLLASQVRLDLGVTALGLAGQSQASTLRLF